MTEMKEKKDTRQYYLLKYAVNTEDGDPGIPQQRVFLGTDPQEVVKEFKDGREEDWLKRVTISIPEPLDMKRVLTKIKINKQYTQDWFYVSKLLTGHIQKLPKRKKGEVGKYLILNPLPSQAELSAMLTQYYTTSAEGLVDEANDEISALKDEIEAWKESIEENFSGSEKYSQLEEALDLLEQYSELEWPSEIEDFGVLYVPPVPKVFRGRVTHSRAARLNEACDKLQTVMDGLEEEKTARVEKLRGLLDDLAEVERTDEQKQQFCDEHGISGDEDPDSLETEYDNFIGEIENNKSEVEGVEFPGMYG